MHLPRLPAELPYIILKNPLEPNADKNFEIRRDRIMDVLKYLQANSEDYRDIEIARHNAEHYPVDSIMQDLPQLKPEE